MYRLNLETLLLVLRGRSGLLEASLSPVPGLRGTCRVHLTLVNGKVAACVIQDQQGNTLSGEPAVQLLQKRVLEWVYQEQQVVPSSGSNTGGIPANPPQHSPYRFPGNEPVRSVQPVQPPAYRDTASLYLHAIPRRVAQPPPYLFQSWTRLQRSVFMLIDGTRSVSTIASLLSQNEAVLIPILLEMVNYGVVQM